MCLGVLLEAHILSPGMTHISESLDSSRIMEKDRRICLSDAGNLQDKMLCFLNKCLRHLLGTSDWLKFVQASGVFLDISERLERGSRENLHSLRSVVMLIPVQSWIRKTSGSKRAL